MLDPLPPPPSRHTHSAPHMPNTHTLRSQWAQFPRRGTNSNRIWCCSFLPCSSSRDQNILKWPVELALSHSDIGSCWAQNSFRQQLTKAERETEGSRSGERGGEGEKAGMVQRNWQWNYFVWCYRTLLRFSQSLLHSCLSVIKENSIQEISV